MTKTQRIVLFAAAAVVSLMMLFPPWLRPLSGTVYANAGYAFITGPQKTDFYSVVDVQRLALQLFAALIVGRLCFAGLASLKPLTNPPIGSAPDAVLPTLPAERTNIDRESLAQRGCSYIAIIVVGLIAVICLWAYLVPYN